MACFVALLLGYLAILPMLIDAESKAYIVYMGKPLARKSMLNTASLHQHTLASVLGAGLSKESMLYSYSHVFNGFSAVIPAHKVEEISKLPGVMSVMEDKLRKVDTTYSWKFLNLRDSNGSVSNGPLEDSRIRGGQNVIIGVFDTGIWPKSASFDDSSYGPIPERWKGSCVDTPDFSSNDCNKKLIGAKYFLKGFEAGNNKLDESDSVSPLDTEGHGTHTSSTAVGSFVENASYRGLGKGTASGGAYGALLAVYKVCWTKLGLCSDSDILAAFDECIKDGCDVVSLSAGSKKAVYLFEDPIAVGAFYAVLSGITVVLSAGNGGPVPSSVSNLSPWSIAVAASTTDRVLASNVVLGNLAVYNGESLTVDHELETGLCPVISAANVPLPNISSNQSSFCLPGTLDPEKVQGKIVLCRAGIITISDKGRHVQQAKGVGLIVYNSDLRGETIIAQTSVLPATTVGAKAGKSILAYINSNPNPTAYITKPVTSITTKATPSVASFSSRGPNAIYPDVLKPDIAAPGVNVLAAFTGYNNTDNFKFLSGTSMSCPHVTGIVALLKSLHPDWSPAAILSAVITTAETTNKAGGLIIDDYTERAATPFDYGGGEVDPNRAADPGLVYDSSPRDYFTFLCKQFNSSLSGCPDEEVVNNFELNYPSITVALKSSGPARITRTLKSVTNCEAKFQVRLELSGCPVSASVKPEVLRFMKRGDEGRFEVELSRMQDPGLTGLWTLTIPGVGTFCFGSLTWSDNAHDVRSPVVVKLED